MGVISAHYCRPQGPRICGVTVSRFVDKNTPRRLPCRPLHGQRDATEVFYPRTCATGHGHLDHIGPPARPIWAHVAMGPVEESNSTYNATSPSTVLAAWRSPPMPQTYV